MNEKLLEYFPYLMNSKFPFDDFHLAKFEKEWFWSLFSEIPYVSGLTLAR